MCKIGYPQMTKKKNVRQFIYNNPPRQPDGEVTSTSQGTSAEEDDIQKRRLWPAPRWQPECQCSRYTRRQNSNPHRSLPEEAVEEAAVVQGVGGLAVLEAAAEGAAATCRTVMAAAADPGMPGVGGQWWLRLRLLVHFPSLILL
jgi:hypothetical protein